MRTKSDSWSNLCPMTATEKSLPFDSAWLRDFRRRLRAWYDRHARELPWRGTRDPYAVWLSEIMLQQTQVETVKPYFQRFLAALPTIRALAEADEQQVLRLWEGLGYYRRARQLHQAARQIVAEHDGRFPCDPQSVQRLPGIGRYTAGAILSIAFDQRRPILEANTRAGLQPAAGLRRPNHVRRPARSCFGRRPRPCCLPRRRPLQPGPHGTGQRSLPRPARRPAMSARPRGCVMPTNAGCKTKSPVPSRGRNSKMFPRRPCSSAAAVACS